MPPNDDVNKIKATWDPVTRQIKLTEEAMKSLGTAQNELMADFLRAAQTNVDYYKEVLKHLTDASKEEGDFKTKMAAVGAEVDLTSQKMRPIVDYLATSIANGDSFTESVRNLRTEFAGVAEQAGKTSDFLDQMSKSLKGIGAGEIGKIFSGGKDAFKSFQTGFSELAKVGSGEMGMGAGLMGGATGILGGLEALRELTEPFRKGWADVNKQVLEINANVGKLGEYTDDVTASAGELGNKYNMSLDQVMKLDVSLSKIGTEHDLINKSLDDILARYTAMPGLTPEKQIDMMAQYMSRFGMNSAQANDALGNLYNHSQKIKTELGLTNVSSMEFLERAQGLEISSRSMGYNFGDATARLEIMAKLMKEVSGGAIDLEGATKATSAIMAIGQGNLGMQAYMMKQLPGMQGATPQQEIGAFALGRGREEAQIGMVMNFMKTAGYIPGEETKTPKGREELAGQITLAFKGMGIPLDMQTTKALTDAMQMGPDHFQKAMLDQTKKADDLRKKQTDDTKNMGTNIKDLVGATTTMEQSVVGWLAKIAGVLVEIANHFTIGGGTLEEREAKRLGGTEARMQGMIRTKQETGGRAYAAGMGEHSYEESLATSEELENMKKIITTPLPAGAGGAAQAMRGMEVQVFIKAKQSYESKHPQVGKSR